MSSETVALWGVILAICAVFYQARAYYLSRRELSIKVKDLSEVVNRLEGEINKRQELDKKHKALEIDTMMQYAKALNHASRLGGTNSTNLKLHEQNVNGQISDIQHILIAHNSIVRKNQDPQDAASLQLLDAISTFCKARLDHLEIADDWNSESLTASKEMDGERFPSTPSGAAEKVRFITETTARLEGKYTDRLQVVTNEVINARSQFMRLLQQYIN